MNGLSRNLAGGILMGVLAAPSALFGQATHDHTATPDANYKAVTPGEVKLKGATNYQNREQFKVRPLRVEKGPRIDGVLDDEGWQLAPLIDEFIQQEPKEGSVASERTEVRLMYDARNLYIGLRAFDSEPAGVIATEMRRDSPRILDEDNFQVIIDTFNDHRSGYMFVTSPLGAKLEQQIFEEGEGGGRGINSNINKDWDGVWDAVARQTENGWVAEIAIPTTTLRFKASDEQAWGINFERNIRRKNEQVFWAPIPKAYTITRVSLAGTLDGIRGLSQGMDLRVKPFMTSSFRRKSYNNAATSNNFLGDYGLDMKYGVTSGLNLDITINTDFAQVEADEQQVNLTRFGLFFPEKRDFFLENAGQLNVGTAQGQDAYLFFSRQIGLSSTGQPIPIVGGARLTGKVGKNSIALMDIQTARAFGAPGDNFMVSRYSRDVLARSRVGALFINKEASDHTRFNRTMATDATFALGKSFKVNSYLAKTSSPGIHEGDMSYYTRAGWQDRNWNIWTQYIDIQDNFNAEVGFVPRKGIRTSQTHFAPTPRPGRLRMRMLEPMIQVTYTTDQNNRLLSRRVHHMVAFNMDDGTYINFIYNKYFEQLDKPFRIQRNVSIPTGTYRFGEMIMQLNTSPARRIYEKFTFSPQTFYGGFRKDFDATLGARVSRQLSTEAQYRRNDVNLPFGSFEVNLGTLRVDYAMSPRMTVRSLVQYNSSTHETSTSIRLNWIYRPGSDFYIVYNGLRAASTADVPRDHQIVLKLNYLLSR